MIYYIQNFWLMIKVENKHGRCIWWLGFYCVIGNLFKNWNENKKQSLFVNVNIFFFVAKSASFCCKTCIILNVNFVFCCKEDVMFLILWVHLIETLVFIIQILLVASLNILNLILTNLQWSVVSLPYFVLMPIYSNQSFLNFFFFYFCFFLILFLYILFNIIMLCLIMVTTFIPTRIFTNTELNKK